MRVISCIAQKGGTGKTTTCGALASGLTAAGYNVICVDFDSQANLTRSLGGKINLNKSILQVVRREIKISAAIQKADTCDLVPASPFLTELSFSHDYTLLKSVMSDLEGYDFAIIDSPPALGTFMLNVLIASDEVIIPSGADAFSLDGILALKDTIQAVKKGHNPNLKIDGILITMYDQRTVLSRNLALSCEDIAKQMGTKVFNSKIRNGVAVKEAQLLGQGLFQYSPKAKVTLDYKDLIDELLNN